MFETGQAGIRIHSKMENLMANLLNVVGNFGSKKGIKYIKVQDSHPDLFPKPEGKKKGKPGFAAWCNKMREENNVNQS